MNFDYKILSDPNLSLDFIEKNLDKFTKVDFNILSIFNKNITRDFIEKHILYPWSHYDYEIKLIELRSQFPIDYDSLKKENNKKLRDKFEKIEIKESNTSVQKHRHLKK